MTVVYVVFVVTIVLSLVQCAIVPAGSLSAINDAIAAAQPGEMIFLSSGTFYGCSTDTILLNRNVTLQGMFSVVLSFTE